MKDVVTSSRPRRVLYLVTEDWYFETHRLDHAKQLIKNGFDVHVATRVGQRGDAIRAAGCTVHDFDLARGGSARQLLTRELPGLAKLLRVVQPGIVHAVALKAITATLLLVPFFRQTRFILAVSGLGLSAVDPSPSFRAVCLGLRLASRSKRVFLLFQNTVDPGTIGADPDRITLIPGVGVDTARFTPSPLPADGPLRLVFLGRSVRSKGLLDIAAAAHRLPEGEFEFHLYIRPDTSSPGSLTSAELARLADAPGVVVHPPTHDSAAALNIAHAALLPSHAGEGVSKFTLEALACGRPVVASDSPGNSYVVDEGSNGWLFKPTDVDGLVAALLGLAAARNRLDDLSDTCRSNAVERHSLDILLPAVIELHESAMTVE